MDNKPLLEKEITIEEVKTKTWDNGGVSFSVKSGKDSFTLNKTKVDKSETKAYQFFKTLGFDAVGKTVKILFKEEPKPFTGKDGKTVNYIRRTIVGMGSVGNIPELNPQKQEPAKMSDVIEHREEEVDTSQIPF